MVRVSGRVMISVN